MHRWMLGRPYGSGFSWLCPSLGKVVLHWTPSVRPSYGRDEPLPRNAEEDAFHRGSRWFENAKIFIHPSWSEDAERRLMEFPDGTGAGPEAD